MQLSRSLPYQKLLLLLPFVVIASGLFLILNPILFVGNDSKMFIALTLDLCFTSPLVYLLITYKTKTPKLFMLPLFVLGVALSTLLIPSEHHATVKFITTWVLPIIELTVFAIVITKIYQLKKGISDNKGLEFHDAFIQAATGVLPDKVVRVFAFEASIFYYAFFKWSSPKTTTNTFTYHKESGIKALLYAFLMAIVAETVAIHFILLMWSPIAAWILSGISIYTAIQVFAIIKSINHNPIELGANSVLFKNGILTSTEIPFEAIKSIQYFKSDLPEDIKPKKLSFFYQNTLVELNEEISVRGPYGLKSKTQKIAFYLDDQAAFKNSIKPYLTIEND